MDPQFLPLVKVRVSLRFPASMPKGWVDLKESIYNGQRNFAILTGKTNNITVIDLDNKSGNTKSMEWFTSLFGELDTVNTLVTKSPHNGYHVFFKYDSRLRSTNNKKYNVDILNDRKCTFQGEGYPIINNSTIRELTDNEIDYLKTLY